MLEKQKQKIGNNSTAIQINGNYTAPSISYQDIKSIVSDLFESNLSKIGEIISHKNIEVHQLDHLRYIKDISQVNINLNSKEKLNSLLKLKKFLKPNKINCSDNGIHDVSKKVDGQNLVEKNITFSSFSDIEYLLYDCLEADKSLLSEIPQFHVLECYFQKNSQIHCKETQYYIIRVLSETTVEYILKLWKKYSEKGIPKFRISDIAPFSKQTSRWIKDHSYRKAKNLSIKLSNKFAHENRGLSLGQRGSFKRIFIDYDNRTYNDKNSEFLIKLTIEFLENSQMQLFVVPANEIPKNIGFDKGFNEISIISNSYAYTMDHIINGFYYLKKIKNIDDAFDIYNTLHNHSIPANEYLNILLGT